MNDEILAITELYKSLCTASINKDIDKLNEILADNYILIHMTGMHQTKEEYINSVINGDLKYYESVHDDIDIKIDKDKAVLVSKTRILASVFGISKSWWRLRQDITLEKIDGKWKITNSVASTY